MDVLKVVFIVVFSMICGIAATIVADFWNQAVSNYGGPEINDTYAGVFVGTVVSAILTMIFL